MKSWREFYALGQKPIGHGGQAEVFEAVDRTTNEHVALKRVFSKDPDAVARMQREIQVQMNLNHPNIMPVIRHAKGFMWYTMPLARRALKDVATPMPDDDITTIVRSICLGLHAAHVHRFVHRDITPANILDIGTEQPSWVLSDWGLVRRHGRTTAPPTQPGGFGTEGFAAPEAWTDPHTADHRADIYGLGRVVAWCATGSWPIPNVSLVPPGKWKRFVELTTAHEPSHRCQTVTEMLALLDGKSLARARAAAAQIPAAVQAVIREEAESASPDNYSSQQFRIERQTEAWHRLQSVEYDDIPAAVLGAIIEEAEARSPRDFSMRLFRIDRQVVSFRALRDFHDPSVPSTVLSGIRESAGNRFSRDFSSQLFRLKREIEAWKILNS